ncbi:hypothetical protein B0H19DRAFT_1250314 [Mycena capillaripes]|nr:hypothetical protein B0H19DRAFT_1250314 [Mycena capillaripes]
MDWGMDFGRDVDLGDWLVVEPFMNHRARSVRNLRHCDSNLAAEVEEVNTTITFKTLIVIEAINDEPVLVGISWTYLLTASASSIITTPLAFEDPMGAAASLLPEPGYIMDIGTRRYVRRVASQDQHRDVVCVIGIVNEILRGATGQVCPQSFCYGAYEAIRTPTYVPRWMPTSSQRPPVVL